MNRKIYRGSRGSQRDSRRKRSPYRLLILLLFFGVFVLGIVGARMSIVELTIRVGELEEEKRRVKNEVERLELEVSHLSSRRRIEAIARETLGMRYPGLEEMTYIHEK